MPRGGYRGGVKPTLPLEERKKAKQLMLSPEVLAKLSTIAKREGWSESYLVEQALRVVLGLTSDYTREDLILLIAGVFE